MAFNDITTLEHAATPLEENECLNAVVDALNWAKANAWFIRHGGATYQEGDVVQCPYKRNLELICTQGGTCADSLLDINDCVDGNTITDGTVKWKVRTGWLSTQGGTMHNNISFSGGRIVGASDSQLVEMWGATSWEKGSYLTLSGKDHADAGKFNLVARNDTQSVTLDGRPDGTLNWGGKTVERINQVKWSDETTSTLSGCCVRYDSGLQIFYGSVPYNNSFRTFPLPFKNKPKFTLGDNRGDVDSARLPLVTYIGTTGVRTIARSVITNDWSYTGACDIICIGTWK